MILKDEERNLYGYRRKTKTDEVIVILNNSANEVDVQLPLDSGEVLTDLLTEKRYGSGKARVTLSVAPKSGLLLHRKSPVESRESRTRVFATR